MQSSSRTCLRVITQSEQRTFRRCAREHLHAYEQRYRPIEDAKTLRFGTLIHRGLERYWRFIGRSPLLEAIEAMRASGDSEPYDFALACALLTAYDVRWFNDYHEVLEVEVEFSTPLINPATKHASKTFTLAGKLDAIVRAPDGLFYIVEHKTSSEDLGAGSTYWQRLRIDSQVSTYYEGARALGYEVAGCIYDVLGKPQLRPLKATPVESRKYTKQGTLYANQREQDETPDEFHARLIEHLGENPDRYFQRGVVVRLEAEEREAAFDSWQTTRLIREAELANRYPRNADACPRYGRMCSYFDVCTGAASLDDPTRFRRTETAHEELSHAANDNATTADAANTNA